MPDITYVIFVIYDIYDICDIWHFTCIYISIWVSKEALGPQECSQLSTISYKIVFSAKNLNILFPDFSFVFCKTSFVYFVSLEATLPGHLGS